MSLKEAEIKKEDVSYKLSILDLENAVVAFFYEGKIKMGTLALAIPHRAEGEATTSSVLLGGKYLIASRALAERVAALFSKMSLVSLHTSLPDAEAFKIFVRLLEEFLIRNRQAL